MVGEEVKAGYKLTEFGVIPEDWDVKMLKDLASLIIDGTHKTPQYQAYGVPFLRVTDLKSNKIDVRNLKFISKEEHKFLQERCKPEKGDLLLSKNGTVGVPKAIYWDWEFSIFVSLALIKIRPQKINLYFLEQFIKSNFLDQQIKQRSKQGTVTNLHLEEIREFLIPLPPTLEEQEKIAQVLSDFDSAIAHLDKLINKKRNVKQGTMQQLLTGKKRLPGFSGEWEVKKLGELVEVVMGQSPDSRTYNTKEKGVPLIQGNADISNRKTIKRVWTSQITKLCNQGDVIMTVRAPIGAIGMASYDSCLGRGACSFKAKNINKLYFFYLMIFKEATWETIGQGSTFTAVNSNDILNFPLFIANLLPEQKAIAQILGDMDAEIEALEKKRDKYQAMKQGMMQELLTGKTRLIDQK